MAIEFGPILRFESRLVARRKSGYAVRMAFGLALLALLATYLVRTDLCCTRGRLRALGRFALQLDDRLGNRASSLMERQRKPFLSAYQSLESKTCAGWADAGFFMELAIGATAILLVLMAVTLRPVVRSSLHRTTRRMMRLEALRSAWQTWFRRLPGPTLDGNPVLWRDWWRGRTSWGGRIFWALYVLAACVGTVICVHEF